MPDEVKTQHLIEVLEYIEQVALTRKPEEAITEIQVYCGKLKQITGWYKQLDKYQGEYNSARDVWRESITLEGTSGGGVGPTLKPGLIDNAC